MACDCFHRINRQFAERGATRLADSMAIEEEKDGNPSRFFMLNRAQIVTELCADKKRGERRIEMIATYCPFCGERYEEKRAA